MNRHTDRQTVRTENDPTTTYLSNSFISSKLVIDIIFSIDLLKVSTERQRAGHTVDCCHARAVLCAVRGGIWCLLHT